MIARRRLHRTVFIMAGIYNMAWGLFAVLDPQWLFRCAGMPLQNYPEVFACLGMVIGLYGIIYLEVARCRSAASYWPRSAWRERYSVLSEWLGPSIARMAAGSGICLRNERYHLVGTVCAVFV